MLKEKTDDVIGALTSHWYLLLPSQASGRWNSDSCTRRCGAALQNEETQRLRWWSGQDTASVLTHKSSVYFTLAVVMICCCSFFFTDDKNSCAMKSGQPKFKKKENTSADDVCYLLTLGSMWETGCNVTGKKFTTVVECQVSQRRVKWHMSSAACLCENKECARKVSPFQGIKGEENECIFSRPFDQWILMHYSWPFQF